MNKQLEEKLKDLPRSPGVYFHKARTGEILYVGKAAVLRNRVRQYFQDSRSKDTKTMALVSEIVDTDWIETESEIDALFLESEMVKRYMPRYNVLLRDDKSQMYVRIDMKSEWPHVSFTRNPADDGAEYFGPYYSGYAVRKALRYLRRSFPYYLKQPKNKDRKSLYAHIGLEPTSLSSDQYKTELRKLISYLKGNRKKIIHDLTAEMKIAATKEDFEQAAILRNRLNNLKELKRRIMFGDREFLDISKDRALGQVEELLGLPSPPARIEGFDISHMSGRGVVASQVVFMNGASHRSEYRKYKMSVERNDDYANIHEVVHRRLSPRNSKSWGLPDLMVVDGGKGQLDAAIRALEERGRSVPVIGMAKKNEELYIHQEHSNVNRVRLDELILSPAPGVYVVKDGDYYRVNLHADQLNAGGHSRNLRGGTISVYVDLLKLLQRIRDESHRFAVSYHTSLGRRRQTESVLDTIPDIGPASKRKLLRKFGSVKGIESATEAELALEVGAARARTVWRTLSGAKSQDE